MRNSKGYKTSATKFIEIQTITYFEAFMCTNREQLTVAHIPVIFYFIHFPASMQGVK